VRRLFCLLLLICLPLQSFALQIVGVRLAGTGAAHLLAHAEHVHHHHHDDGKVHYDESDESIQHSHEPSATVQHLLPKAAAALFSPLTVSFADRADPTSYIPDPYLVDPQRPPAFTPGLAAGG
jgi:hypothetical protein